MKKSLIILFLISCLTAKPANADDIENFDKPIRIITNNWTSQIVLANVTGRIFKTMGYKIEYVTATTSQQWGALSHGLAHVQIEVWEGTMSDMFNRMLKEGRIDDLGSHLATTREEWWYPLYVEKSCPGLPDWRALKSCAKLFATSNSSPSGTYYAGPWEKPDEARVRALGLDFKVRVLAHADDLWVVLEKAFKSQQPIVLFNWTPNWVESRYPGRFIEFPDYAPECETDPAWGVSKKFLFDCGNPKGGWLKKAAWPGMKNNWSCAYRTLKNINFNNSQIARAASLVDSDKLSFEKAAEVWLEENETIWNKWIPENCR